MVLLSREIQNASLMGQVLRVLYKILQNEPSKSEQETLLLLNIIAHEPELKPNDIVTYSNLLMKVANSSGKVSIFVNICLHKESRLNLLLFQVEAEVTDVFADNANRAIDMLESIPNNSQKSNSLRILGETIERFVLKQDVAERKYIQQGYLGYNALAPFLTTLVVIIGIITKIIPPFLSKYYLNYSE